MISNIKEKQKPITSVKFPHIPADQFTPNPTHMTSAGEQARGGECGSQSSGKSGGITKQNGKTHLEKEG